MRNTHDGAIAYLVANARNPAPEAWSVTAQPQKARSLLPHHLHALEKRWITAELATTAGLYSVDSTEGALLVGRRNTQGKSYAGIVIPYRWPDGSLRESRLRRDEPDSELGSDGKLHEKTKYVSPPGARVLLYDPP